MMLLNLSLTAKPSSSLANLALISPSTKPGERASSFKNWSFLTDGSFMSAPSGNWLAMLLALCLLLTGLPVSTLIMSLGAILVNPTEFGLLAAAFSGLWAADFWSLVLIPGS